MAGSAEGDKLALLTWKAQGNNAEVGDRTPSWDESSEPCGEGWHDIWQGWHGVECDGAGGRVTVLHLDHQHDMVGDVALLAPLTRLRRVNFHRCHEITGDIVVFGAMHQLEELDMLGTAVHGAPSSLVGASRLHHLSLGLTNVAGSVSILQVLRNIDDRWQQAAQGFIADEDEAEMDDGVSN